MSWFRKNDRLAELAGSNRLPQLQATECVQPLPEEAQAFLDKALESMRKLSRT